MDRRVAVAVLVAAGIAALLVVASSSGPVRLWSEPPERTTASTVARSGPGATVVTQPPVVVVDDRRSAADNTLLQIIGLAFGAVALFAAARMLRGWEGLAQLRGWRARRTGPLHALPEPVERELSVDVAAARVALVGGTPRNAIVACWMQLERDAATAGLPRASAETSAEYAERVVASSSVDPSPIGELAALYREARFSRHEMHDDHRALAGAALAHVERALVDHVAVGR